MALTTRSKICLSGAPSRERDDDATPTRCRGVAAIAAAAVCTVGLLLCLSNVPLHAAGVAAPVDRVIACTYAKNGTPEAACKPDVYQGENFTYECATGDTPLPTGANGAGGKYCETMLDDKATTCTKAATLPGTVGEGTAASDVVTVSVNAAYDESFKDPIMYYVRCDKSGQKIYIGAKLWPISRPLSKAPRKKCNAADDTDTTAAAPCRFFIYQSDTAQGIDCRPSTASITLVPADFHNGSSGNVCTAGLTGTNTPACKGGTKDTWTNTVPGLTVAALYTNQGVTLTPGSLTAKRAEAFIACYRNAGRKLFMRGWFYKSDFVGLDDAHIKMIKHVCTPTKGNKVDAPCEITLAADEAVALQCAPYATNANYTLIPDDTNTADGNFCTAKLKNFKDQCTEKKKWKDEAYAVASQDPTLDYIVVAHPTAMADKLKTQVMAYGACSDQTNGLAWKITFGKAKAPAGGDTPDKSGALGRFPGYVAIGAGTILLASFMAAAAY